MAVTALRYSLNWSFHSFQDGFTLLKKLMAKAMIPIRMQCRTAALSLVIALLIFLPLAAASEKSPDDAALLASVCPVVYPLDEFPT